MFEFAVIMAGGSLGGALVLVAVWAVMGYNDRRAARWLAEERRRDQFYVSNNERRIDK